MNEEKEERMMKEERKRHIVYLFVWCGVFDHSPSSSSTTQASWCVKRLLEQEKQSSHVVLSASPETGLKVVDTNFNPPKVQSVGGGCVCVCVCVCVFL